MEPLKPRDKVTQHMTRDGLTLDNQTTGENPLPHRNEDGQRGKHLHCGSPLHLLYL